MNQPQQQPNQSPAQNPDTSFYPKPQGSSPQPPPQPQNPPPKSNTTKTVLIVCGVILGIFILVIGGLAAMVFFGLNSAKDKAKDARIKSDVSVLRTTAETYYSEKQTYVGLSADQTIISDIQTQGSKLVIQGLSSQTYVIYAKLPSSGKIYCADSSNNGVEVTNVSPTQTSCQ